MRERIAAVLVDGGIDVLVAPSADALRELWCEGEIELAVYGCQRSALRRPWQLAAMRREAPDVRLLVVSSGDGRQVVRDAMAAGADGYVAEERIDDRLVIGSQAVVAGYVCVPQSMRRQVVRVAFTRRERQVLTLLRQGYSNQQMAQRLFLSESTIKSHLASAFRKLGVTSRIEAAAILSDPGELERYLGPVAWQLVRKRTAAQREPAPLS
jgi:DNA-binding NarL/FixJ family response regulator